MTTQLEPSCAIEKKNKSKRNKNDSFSPKTTLRCPTSHRRESAPHVGTFVVATKGTEVTTTLQEHHQQSLNANIQQSSVPTFDAAATAAVQNDNATYSENSIVQLAWMRLLRCNTVGRRTQDDKPREIVCFISHATLPASATTPTPPPPLTQKKKTHGVLHVSIPRLKRYELSDRLTTSQPLYPCMYMYIREEQHTPREEQGPIEINDHSFTRLNKRPTNPLLAGGSPTYAPPPPPTSG